MRIIRSDSHDVYFNLATEQYLLHEQSEDILMLWQSESAVVCGKHQNACAEANYAFCKENNIHIARRLSGGGTVFHDLGNVNFTFVKALSEGMERAVDYKRYLEPIREVLSNLGIQTTYSERDDLLLNGLKISGNAQHIYQKGLKGLHHGTLLYDSDLASLNTAIHSEGAYEGKSVPSNRSEVTNIREWTDLGATSLFIGKLCHQLESLYGVTSKPLTDIEKSRCQQISDEKFSQESWILGYSPRYIHERSFLKDGKRLHLTMMVHQDEIKNCVITDDQKQVVYPSESEQLIGRALRFITLKQTFTEFSEKELLNFF